VWGAAYTAILTDASAGIALSARLWQAVKMQQLLTSQERMTRMLEHRDHDRIPRHDGYWPETIARWNREGFAGDRGGALKFLQNDLTGVCWSWPVPFPGREEILSEDAETKVVRGSMGKVERVWKNKWGTPEHIAFGCDSPAKWHSEYKPALLASRLSPSITPPDNAKCFAGERAAGKFCCLQGVEAFESLRQLVATSFCCRPCLKNRTGCATWPRRTPI